MVDSNNVSSGTHFWILDPLPGYMNVWIFKSNRISGRGEYISIQPNPSGVTLRYIVKGSWRIRMCGVEKDAGPGDIFCAFPSEHIIFSQVDVDEWEWLELQFNGDYAKKFLLEFGLSEQNPVTAVKDPEKAMDLFEKLYLLIGREQRSIPEALSLLFELVRVCDGKQENYAKPPELNRKIFVTKLIDYLEAVPSIRKNISELAEHFGVDRSTVYRAFKDETGKSPHEYIEHLKLERARELLLSTNMTVAEVSRNCGFSDVKYFTGWFKKNTGTSPGKHRKLYKSFND